MLDFKKMVNADLEKLKQYLNTAEKEISLYLKKIKLFGGYAIVQDPKTAQATVMPTAAMKSTNVDYIGSLEDIAQRLCDMAGVEVAHG